MRFLPLLLLVAVALVFTAGCAKKSPLPTYPAMSESAALAILATRANAIESLSGEGQLQLTRADNSQGIRLDAAIAMRPPDQVRLRAWKFGQAVFDLTLTPQGLWLVADRSDQHRDEVLKAGGRAGEFTKGWSLFSGGFFSDPQVKAEYRGKWLLVRRLRESEPTVTCYVDRDTLTPRRFVMQDENGVERFSLTLDRYATVGGTVWPYRVAAESSSGRIVFEARELELNGELPPRAFIPPARAERLR